MKAHKNFEDMFNDPEYFSEEDKAELADRLSGVLRKIVRKTD